MRNFIEVKNKKGEVVAVVKIDQEDFDKVIWRNWQVGKMGYAQTTINKKTILMHRLIMGLSPSDKQHIDHINGDKLNNRKENLRFCTPSQNQANCSKKRENTTSKYKGVCWLEGKKRWRAAVVVNGKRIYKLLKTEEEAVKKANELMLQYFGEFAKLNDI